MVRYSSRLVVRRSMRLVRPDCVCVYLSLLFACLSAIVRLSFTTSYLLLFGFLVFTYSAYLRLISLPSCKFAISAIFETAWCLGQSGEKKFREAFAERISEGRKRRRERQSGRSNASICKKVRFFFLIRKFKQLSAIAFCHAAAICAVYAVATAMKWLQRYIFIVYPLDRDIKWMR